MGEAYDMRTVIMNCELIMSRMHCTDFLYIASWKDSYFVKYCSPYTIAYYIRAVSFYLIFEYRCSDATSQLYLA